MHRTYAPALLLSGSLVIVAACGGSSPQATGSPGAESRNTTPAAKSRSGSATKIDLDKIFPPGQGRDLVLGNCQNCHTFAPIVVLQMDKEAWHRNSLDHRERVTTLSDQEFATLYDYLTANFGPDHPVPDLPKEFLKSWTSY